jgi:hypothetical protein
LSQKGKVVMGVACIGFARCFGVHHRRLNR